VAGGRGALRPVQQDQPRARHGEGQAEQRGDEQHDREGGEVDGLPDVEGDQEEQQRERDRDRQQQVQEQGRERHHEDRQHPEDACGERDVSVAAQRVHQGGAGSRHRPLPSDAPPGIERILSPPDLHRPLKASPR
jgi:hypothetical protein